MDVIQDPKQWVAAHFSQAELGDPRRTQRLMKTAEAKVHNMTAASIPKLVEDSAQQEGAYRFFENDKVSAEEIARSGCAYTVGCLEAEDGPILAIQDSTTLSYDRAPEGSGPLGGPKNSGSGAWIHSTLLVDPESAQPLGLATFKSWIRSKKKVKETGRAYEDKESYRWEEAHRELCERAGERQTNLILVADREAEGNELLGYLCATGSRFVLRSRVSRLLTEGPKLQTPSRYAEIGKAAVQLAQRGNPHGRSARTAHVEIRGGHVELSARSSRYDEPIRMQVVHIVEPKPPKEAHGIEWWLLTSEPVENLEDALKVMGYYRQRWLIEDFHKAWKSGTKVEEIQFQHIDNIVRYATILAFIAVRMLQLRELTATYPKAKATLFLSDMEWKVLYLVDKQGKSRRKPKLPKNIPTMKWAHQALAKLGGFGDTKGTGRPGWQCLWEGYFILQERLEGFMLALRLTEGDL